MSKYNNPDLLSKYSIIQEEELNSMFSEEQVDKEKSMNTDLPMMALSTILKNTNSFSDEQNLYGILPDGRQIAVKRL